MSGKLHRYTPNTITTPAALRADLREVRERGIAYDREEYTEGICAVGALIDAADPAPMAVSVPMPAQRFYGREEELAAALLAMCVEIRKELGVE